MATLQSDKVDGTLRNKMKAERRDSVDWRYIICNEQGEQLSSTRISNICLSSLRYIRLLLYPLDLLLSSGYKTKCHAFMLLQQHKSMTFCFKNLTMLHPTH
jgi:hypothetical protein